MIDLRGKHPFGSHPELRLTEWQLPSVNLESESVTIFFSHVLFEGVAKYGQ